MAEEQSGSNPSKREVYRFTILQLFISKPDEVLTQKEIEDWAKEQGYELHRFRIIAQALVKEGYLRMRKPNATASNTNAYYWINFKDLKPKLDKAFEQFQSRLCTKEKKNEKTIQQLEEQYSLRDGLEGQIALEEQLNQDLEEAKFEQRKHEECTQDNIDDLEFKLNVGISEATKWTDYTYQVMQYIQQRSKYEVSFDNINRTFPYLKNVDCSLMLEPDNISEDSISLQEEALVNHEESWSEVGIEGHSKSPISPIESEPNSCSPDINHQQFVQEITPPLSIIEEEPSSTAQYQDALSEQPAEISDLIGKELEHPFIQDRTLKIIADPVLVDMAYGTGAVKITPAHDHNDYACGKRHQLAQINVFDEEGRINQNGGKYAGMMRFDCRVQIYKDMEALGLIKGKKPNAMRLGLCSKSNDIIEPYLKPQWYADCKELAKRSCDAVRNKDLVILPQESEQTWFDWLEKIQDWCISRQLWWGHRIPAYLCKIPGVIDHPDSQNQDHYVVGRNEAEARTKAAAKFGVAPEIIELSQDEDVLDTWFSSGLFPFATLGWPDVQDPDFKAFFPGDLLETGGDIIFFWVARMVMMSLCLTDKLPFHHIFLHPMVRDEKGKKMSKSKGNVIDPLEVMDGCSLDALLSKITDSNLPESEIKEAVGDKKKKFPTGIPECGTDALRFGLLSYMIQSSINLDVQRVVGYRQFCNKLWNIVKFALTNLPEGFTPQSLGPDTEGMKLSLADKWILTRLSKTQFETYKFGELVNGLYDFWLKDLADVYIEAIKPVMRGTDEEAKKAARNTLFRCLDSGLRLLHPTMPYLTEELFQRLPHRDDQRIDSICIAPYPEQQKTYEGENVEEKLYQVMNGVKAFRSQLSALNAAKGALPHLIVRCRTDEWKSVFISAAPIIQSLVKSSDLNVLGPADLAEPEGCVKNHVNEDLQTYIKVVGLIDIKLEIDRLKKRQNELKKYMDDLQKKMTLPNYETKVPENVRAENSKKFATYETEYTETQKSQANLAQFLQ